MTNIILSFCYEESLLLIVRLHLTKNRSTSRTYLFILFTLYHCDLVFYNDGLEIDFPCLFCVTISISISFLISDLKQGLSVNLIVTNFEGIFLSTISNDNFV